MRLLIALALGMIASICRGQDDRAKPPEKWQAKIMDFQGLSDSAFRAAIRSMARPRHVCGEIQSVGGSVYRASWSGSALQLDEDWWIVREAAEPTNVGPPPAGVPVKLSVVGIEDLRKEIDPTLYEAVRVIHRSPGFLTAFDPVNLIRAVNFLHMMGEAKAVSALQEYVRLCLAHPDLVWHQLDSERVILLARLLWEAPDKGAALRPPMLGAPSISVMRGTVSEALFPLALGDDVPFLINGGYRLGGVPEDAMSYVRYCRANGVFRKRPMAPGNDPVAAGTGVIAVAVADLDPRFNPAWQRNHVEELVRVQAIRATGAPGMEIVSDDDWRTATVASGGLRWNAARQDFVEGK